MRLLVEGEFAFYLGDKLKIVSKVSDCFLTARSIFECHWPREFFRLFIGKNKHGSCSKSSIDCISCISSAINLTDEIWGTGTDERYAHVLNVRSPFILRIILK